MPTKQTNPKVAEACIKVVEDAFRRMAPAITFSQAAESIDQNIIEYESRMRVFGMEIFNATCFIAVINYYLSEQHQKNHDASGALVVYIEESVAGRLLKALGYRDFDEDEEGAVLEKLGQFAQVLAESYKQEIGQPGLILAPPKTYRNTVPEGVEFSYDQYTKYQTKFFIWKQKALAVDVTLKA